MTLSIIRPPPPQEEPEKMHCSYYNGFLKRNLHLLQPLKVILNWEVLIKTVYIYSGGQGHDSIITCTGTFLA